MSLLKLCAISWLAPNAKDYRHCVRAINRFTESSQQKSHGQRAWSWLAANHRRIEARHGLDGKRMQIRTAIGDIVDDLPPHAGHPVHAQVVLDARHCVIVRIAGEELANLVRLVEH